MPYQRITGRPAAPSFALEAALVHIGQSKLLLRRAACGLSDEGRILALRDLSSILQFVLEEIGSLARPETGRSIL